MYNNFKLHLPIDFPITKPMLSRFLLNFCIACMTVSINFQTGIARSVFLNGQDVSSAYGEQLKGVDVYIDQNGDIYIAAPQYQIILESTKNPLSLLETKKMQDMHTNSSESMHQKLQTIAGSAKSSLHKNAEPQGSSSINEPVSTDVPTVREK